MTRVSIGWYPRANVCARDMKTMKRPPVPLPVAGEGGVGLAVNIVCAPILSLAAEDAAITPETVSRVLGQHEALAHIPVEVNRLACRRPTGRPATIPASG